MDLKIDVNEGVLKDAVSEAIVRAIDEKQRDILIQRAVRELLMTDGRNGTPLERAFREAVASVARDMAAEMVRSDLELNQKIRALIVDAAAKVFGADRDKVVDKIAEGIASAICGGRDY